jgi:putative phage-type endonuclease
MGITDVQRAMRSETIGSSDVAAILGLSPFASAWDIWAEKTGVPMRQRQGTEATELGDEYEAPLVRWAATQVPELHSIRYDEVLIHPDHSILVANADAVGIEGGAPVGIESKTAGLCGPLVRHEWGKSRSDEIPDRYWIQTQFQMACGGLSRVYVPVLLGGVGRVLYVVPRDDNAIGRMIEAVLDFVERYVQTRTPPPATPGEDTIERIIRQPKSKTDLPASAAATIAEWRRLRDARLKFEHAEEKAKAKVIGLLGTAEAGTLPDGSSVTYLEYSRSGYTVAPCKYRSAKFLKRKG